MAAESPHASLSASAIKAGNKMKMDWWHGASAFLVNISNGGALSGPMHYTSDLRSVFLNFHQRHGYDVLVPIESSFLPQFVHATTAGCGPVDGSYRLFTCLMAHIEPLNDLVTDQLYG